MPPTSRTATRRDADERAVRPGSIPSEAVCRQRLSGTQTGTQIPAGAEARPRSDQRGNREAVRPWQIHRAAQALDRRTVDWLAQPVPPPGQRLGMSQPERSGISTLGVHPADGQKALSDHHMIPDGLLDPGAPKETSPSPNARLSLAELRTRRRTCRSRERGNEAVQAARIRACFWSDPA